MNAKHDKWTNVCIKCACGVHMWCMCKAWLSTFGSKCVKHTTNDQNMINMYKQGNSQCLVLIGVQNNTKMPFGHFLKHLVCTNTANMKAMYEHVWILPKYKLKRHKGPTQTQSKQEIENKEKINWNFFWHNSKFSTLIQKWTQFKQNLESKA